MAKLTEKHYLFHMCSKSLYDSEVWRMTKHWLKQSLKSSRNPQAGLLEIPCQFNEVPQKYYHDPQGSQDWTLHPEQQAA